MFFSNTFFSYKLQVVLPHQLPYLVAVESYDSI